MVWDDEIVMQSNMKNHINNTLVQSMKGGLKASASQRSTIDGPPNAFEDVLVGVTFGDVLVGVTFEDGCWLGVEINERTQFYMGPPGRPHLAIFFESFSKKNLSD